MVYSGWNFILFLVFGCCMTSNFMRLTFSILRSSSLWRIPVPCGAPGNHKSVIEKSCSIPLMRFAKLNNSPPPSLLRPHPRQCLKKISTRGAQRGFTYTVYYYFTFKTLSTAYIMLTALPSTLQAPRPKKKKRNGQHSVTTVSPCGKNWENSRY